MQKVAAYPLERRGGMFAAAARNAEVKRLRAEVWKWLDAKGASQVAAAGSYSAEDGSEASFTSEEADDAGRSWSMVRLAEVTPAGRRFVASVSVTTAKESVAVYASLEAGSSASQINPVVVRPKCPRVIRSLLALPGQWFHGASRLRQLERVKGFEPGEELALELLSPERTVPWVVVTETHGQLALPGLDAALEYDLAGLANVARLDADATWALTDNLGRYLSCFLGAVRIYWPRLTLKDDPFRHALWTAQHLQAASENTDETLTRFRNQLRGLIMRASALSVVRPREIDEIRANASRRTFEEMKARANSVEDFQALANVYASDNDKLLATNKGLQDRIAEHRTTIAALEEVRSALLVRVQNAELQLQYRQPNEDAIAPDNASAADPAMSEGSGSPTRGEVRFYKKKHSAPSHDIMVHVSDCGCDNWQGGHAGDKAKKGIAKLEDGRNDWSTIHHCGSCTGGGRWKIVW